MKKTIKLAVVAALALGATSAFATNGDVMIGQGAKSRAMGGVGIAKSFGAESGLANPAMIASVEKSEATLVVTAFAPNVSFKSNTAASAQGSTAASTYSSSTANFSVIPEIAYATRINDNLVVGLSISGTAGMGTDYGQVPFSAVGDNGAFKMKTTLELMKVAVPVSYSVGGFTAGVAAVMQYGTLQMSHMYDQDGNKSTNTATTGFALLDEGISSDVGYGLEVGASYDMKSIVKGLTLGAVYKSKIGMTYKNTISSSINAFGGAVKTGVNSGDNLDQPEERGLGLSYTITQNTIAIDYKNIAWADAAGYGDFGWENQDVYALGYEYATKKFAVRLGYNYAKNPITEQDGSTGAGNAAYGNAVKNFFNLSGFPGVIETHYTIGGSYAISDVLSFDGSFIYAPEVEVSYDTTGMTYGIMEADTVGSYTGETSSSEVKHSQMALTLAMSYKF